MSYPTIWPQFFTASIYRKHHILKDDKYKDIIISSLRYLVHDNRIELNAFAIMSNHIHTIWQPLKKYSLHDIQASFMRQTAKQILNKMASEEPDSIGKLKVNKYDRHYQVWKRQPLSVELFSEKVFLQKFDYIHFNPVKAGITLWPKEYKYCSAKFYETGVDEFHMLTHYTGN